MNKVHLAGYMCKEPDYRMTNNGSAYTRFTMRVAGTTKNKETGKYESDFFDLVAFGKTGETIANYIHDKQFFAVTCHLKKDKYTDKNGDNRTSISIIVDNIDDFPPKASQQSNFDNMGEEIMF